MSGDADAGADAAPPWNGGWQAHREEQRRTWMAATPAQRLAWLESAIAFAHRAGALPQTSDHRPERHPG